MTFSIVRAPSQSFDLYYSGSRRLEDINCNGINLITARRELELDCRFEVIDRTGAGFERPTPRLPDLMVWSWIPIFSAAGYSLALDAGSLPESFVRCNIGDVKDFHYVHLPQTSFDIAAAISSVSVDADFETVNYLFGGIGSIAIKRNIPDSSFPACFRVRFPGTDQVFQELFSTEIFRNLWRKAALSGAVFFELKYGQQESYL